MDAFCSYDYNIFNSLLPHNPSHNSLLPHNPSHALTNPASLVFALPVVDASFSFGDSCMPDPYTGFALGLC
jgi:hypothetical protein